MKMQVAKILLLKWVALTSLSLAFHPASPPQRSSSARAATTSQRRRLPVSVRRRAAADDIGRLRHCATSDPLEIAERSDWIMKHGMLFSSFSDGVVRNPDAQLALRRGLVRAVLRQMQQEAESNVHQSVLHSPCAGPNVQFLNRLEVLDRALLEVETCRDPVDALGRCLCELQDGGLHGVPEGEDRAPFASVVLRFVYVPTAMYALRRDSTNTPGKQRQRARADAKKRRDEICDMVLSLFQSTSIETKLDISLHVVTLDWDDGSLKHSAVLESTRSSGLQAPETQSQGPLPTTGKLSMTEWKPHLLYVQGGNTFWLHHCLDKGGWGPNVVNLVNDGATYYCGSSAGAILAGWRMEVATWKEWDDCGVVPGRSRYRDWDPIRALGLVGPHSFFPHMTDEWNALVEDKRAKDEANNFVVCLRDQDVCLVDGTAQSLTIVSAAPLAEMSNMDASSVVSTPVVVA